MQKTILVRHTEANFFHISRLYDNPCSGTVYAVSTFCNEISRYFNVVVENVNNNTLYIYKSSELVIVDVIEEPDVVIYIGSKSCTREGWRKGASKNILWLHNPEIINKQYDKKFDEVVCVSYNHLLRMIKINRARLPLVIKMRVIYNIFDSDIVSDLIEPNKSLGLTASGETYMYVGNTSKEKGFDLAVSDFYARKNEGDSFHVFGSKALYDSKSSNEIPQEIAMKIDDALIFHGSISRKLLYQYLNRAVYIYAGIGGNETFCYTALEAAALNKKILTVSKGGQHEVLGSNHYELIDEKRYSICFFNLLGRIKSSSMNKINVINKWRRVINDENYGG